MFNREMHNKPNEYGDDNEKKLDSNNLKVLEDQLSYESLMNKKFTNYAEYCTDTELKVLCQEAAKKHKQHYNSLLNYLNSHQ